MTKISPPTVDGIKILINVFLNHKEYMHVVEDASHIICQLIHKHKDALIKIDKNGHPNYNLPYDKIADEIYNHKNTIFFESLSTFVNTVHPYVEKGNDIQVTISYRKLTRHILLAVRQKNFITEVTRDAKTVAEKASNTAKEAESLADATKKELKDSVVSYITILGIFATIIFALFGAVNLISAVNSLLASENRPKLTTILLLTSVLVASISTLLVMLMSWLNEVKGLGEARWRDRVYLKIYSAVLVVSGIMFLISAYRLM
ncbi:hypothetical protein [Acinetobacter larvae]|uniref:Uncharacterized protein n=1 Tax=Acinetobacter larvae TaxID=1789224 RepID=A0A1B2LZM0_9GAMM|nr:hypothetical protein [Acinetobacter larvae]AOA58223.1 hypothetical protein BFG52_07570 [Acinetobacter larvae]